MNSAGSRVAPGPAIAAQGSSHTVLQLWVLWCPMPSEGLASESNSDVMTPLTALGPSVHYLQMHLPLGCHGVKKPVAITTRACAGGRAVWGECPITVSEGADPERQWCMGTSPGGGREMISLPFQSHGASKQCCLLVATSFSLSLVIPPPQVSQ